MYPLTIIKDRYNGTYSKGNFTAWNIDFNEVPIEIMLNDMSCAEFWDNNKIIVGKGKTAQQAISNLSKKLQNAELKRWKNKKSQHER